jgi:hypothetical protein
MGVPISLLNRLRAVNANYFMTNKVKVYRIETFMDEFGGSYSDNVLLGEFPCRFVHLNHRERLVGQNIAADDSYDFVFPFDVSIEFQDRITIVGDNHPNRYFLVVSVDDTTSEGIFNTARCTENYN